VADARARKLRRNRTEAELAVWARLRRKQLNGIRFRQQVPVGPYIVDFLCLSHRLIVEIDGGQHATQILKDDRRARWLESQRFAVLRFWNNDVSGNLDGVIETISRWLLSNPPPPP
jgi:very-short-patch-repair endonuclease